MPVTPRLVPIQKGWAKNAINAVIFRNSSITTYGQSQITAFYNEQGRMVLAKRRLDSTAWETQVTPYSGNVKDAHNTISLAVDGEGFLHLAWDHHNHPLRYCRSVAPGALELTEKRPMTGQFEERVTYPEFHNLPDGGLLFLYRDGMSGDGNLMLNRYDLPTRTWSVVQHGFIDGQGKRNAYPNRLAIDGQGGLHLSWCWRETPDVATNHDICYAKSVDGGRTWRKSTGETYTLPITIENAECVWPVPQNHEFVNQTSMAVDAQGHPLIATYWRPGGTEVPQYQLVYFDGRGWQARQLSQRKMPFSLRGPGSKRVPMSRPMILAGSGNRVYIIFRDEERHNRVSVAFSQDAAREQWQIQDLTAESVGFWEPSYDSMLWQRTQQLHIFVQRVGQGDGETLDNLSPQVISILEWNPE